MSHKTLWVLIGPSGSGKSTISTKIIQANPKSRIAIYSWDALRLEWYGSDYRDAWYASTQDNTFKSRTMAEFQRLLTEGINVIVDNTNLTPKARRKFITQAKQHGYRTVGVMFNTPIEVLWERQKTRTDKSVPASSIADQYKICTPPEEGEFDIIYQAEDMFR